MTVYDCNHCGFIYDSFNGDCKNGVPENIEINILKKSLCNNCGMSKGRQKPRIVTPYQGKEAELYDQFCGQADIHAYITNSDLVKPISLLDIGAGTGRICVPLAKAGMIVTAIDDSEEMLAKLRRKQEYNNIHFPVIKGNILDCDLPNEKYSIILLSDGFLQHVPEYHNKKRLFEKLQKNLAPNGRIIVEIFIPSQHQWEQTLRKEQMDGIELYFTSKGTLSLAQKKMMTTLDYEVYKEHISSYRYRIQRELDLILLDDITFILPDKLKVLLINRFDQTSDWGNFHKDAIIPEKPVQKYWTVGGYPIQNNKSGLVSWWRIEIGFR